MTPLTQTYTTTINTHTHIHTPHTGLGSQVLANNLLARAVALSRHAAAGPDACVAMAVAVAGLQLEQAHALLARGDAPLAVCLLSAAHQQASSPELPLARATLTQHVEGLVQARREVLLLLCRAQLAAGDARGACASLEALQRAASAGGAPPPLAAADPDTQLLALRIQVAAGRLPEALQLLGEAARGCDTEGSAGAAVLRAWLAGLELVLPAIEQAQLHAFQARRGGGGRCV